MAQILILSFIADDRPGLVDRISETVTEAGGNWLESRMAHLAEKFAGIARIEVSENKARQLKKLLDALEAEGIRLTVEEASEEKSDGGKFLTLDLVGPDHPGIVKDISRCLHERGVSIEEMETNVRDAPMGGGTLFYGRMLVRGPVGLNEEDLLGDLERLSTVLMVDITLREEILATKGVEVTGPEI